MRHIRRWGAVYILLMLFLGSWLGQLWAMRTTVGFLGWETFWAATFENWQSEFLQLVVQALLLLAARHWLFRADAEDTERMEAKIDLLLTRHGLDPRSDDEKKKPVT